MRRLLVPLLALAALAAAPAALRGEMGPEEKKFPNEAYPKELRDRVNAAILRGANFLLLKHREDGSWESRYSASYPMGPAALCTLALLKCGVPAGHPKVARAFQYLRRQPLRKTYEVAVLLMALDAKYDPAPDPFAKEELDRYGQRVVAEPCADLISKDDLAWMKEGMEFLVSKQNGGCWRYPEGGFDLSNTQYALLGLKAADRCGLRVPEGVWRSSLDFLLKYQAADGERVAMRANEVRGDYRVEWTEKARARGFGYVAGAPSSGSMTTAGAAGLMICQGMLWRNKKFQTEDADRTREAVRDAMAWMQRNFDVRANPGHGAGWHYYYLYGLERMGILGHARFLGTHDWYAEGAEVVLADQEDLGGWAGGDVVETSFALLFLKRASFRSANPVLTPDVGGGVPGMR